MRYRPDRVKRKATPGIGMKATLKLKIKIYLPDGTYVGEIASSPTELDGKLIEFLMSHLQKEEKEKKSTAVVDASVLLGVDESTIWRRLRKIFL